MNQLCSRRFDWTAYSRRTYVAESLEGKSREGLGAAIVCRKCERLNEKPSHYPGNVLS